MVLSELLPRIDPAWREDYVRFVETGEASDDLLAYLDEHEDCRELVEFVFADPVETEAAAVAERARSGHADRRMTKGA